jgi:hypothetical protein
MAASSGTAIATAIAAVVGAGAGIYSATQSGGKAQGQPQAAKDPNANVYKDRNAQNAIVQGGTSTGTGSLLTSSGNIAGNTLLGQ